MNDSVKTCNKCNESKSLIYFYKRKKSQDGYEYTCKECKKVYDKEYKTNNIEKIKQYELENKEKITKYTKKHYIDNKEKIANYHKEHYKKYQYQKSYKEKNKEKINNYSKLKYHSDPQSKLKNNISNRIRSALKKKNTRKDNKTVELLGCTIEFYKKYLEEQFKSGMTWDNHGIIWEIDHILPCSSFNLEDINQQKQCFHYSNTQPLMKTENRVKSSKINFLRNY